MSGSRARAPPHQLDEAKPLVKKGALPDAPFRDTCFYRRCGPRE